MTENNDSREKLEAEVDELTEERDQLLEQIQEYAEEAANFEQTAVELNGAVCERDGRISAYERRNAELNDALKAICNRYGVGTKWAAEDAVKNVFEVIDSTYMRLPVDADGVPIRPGDVLETPMIGNSDAVYRMTVENVIWDGADWFVEDTCGVYSVVNARHVKPETVESLLEEFGRILVPENAQDGLPEFVERYAERIRKAVDND